MWVQFIYYKKSSVLLCFPNVTSAIIFPSMGLTLPIWPNNLCGCGFTGFPTRDAIWRLIKLLLNPVSTMAQLGRSSSSHFTHIPGLRLKLPFATTVGSSVFLASKTTGSLLCRILRHPGLALLICVSKGGGGGVSCKTIDRGFIFRENATWAKIFVHLVPSGLINVSRLRKPAVSVLCAPRPISVRYVRSIAKLAKIVGRVFIYCSS